MAGWMAARIRNLLFTIAIPRSQERVYARPGRIRYGNPTRGAYSAETRGDEALDPNREGG